MFVLTQMALCHFYYPILYVLFHPWMESITAESDWGTCLISSHYLVFFIRLHISLKLIEVWKSHLLFIWINICSEAMKENMHVLSRSFNERFSNIIRRVDLVSSIEMFKDATNAWKENERTLYVPVTGLKVKWSLLYFESSSMCCVCIVYIKVPVLLAAPSKPNSHSVLQVS